MIVGSFICSTVVSCWDHLILDNLKKTFCVMWAMILLHFVEMSFIYFLHLSSFSEIIWWSQWTCSLSSCKGVDSSASHDIVGLWNIFVGFLFVHKLIIWWPSCPLFFGRCYFLGGVCFCHQSSHFVLQVINISFAPCNGTIPKDIPNYYHFQFETYPNIFLFPQSFAKYWNK